MTIIYIILFFLNLLIFINFNKLAKIINIYDKPDNNLKLHKIKTPILGGIILLINYICFIIYQIIFLNDFLFIQIDLYKIREIIGIIILIFGFLFLGLYDDKYNLSPTKKLILSLILIFVSISLNQTLKVNEINLSFYKSKIFLENFSIIFTIFCLLILVNSLNFYDGINGQSCIFFIIVFSYLLIISDVNEFYLVNIFILINLLFLNLKNKLFLGDGGIYFLSIIVSISFIYEYNLKENIKFVDEIFFILLLPGFDLVRLTFIRVLNGKNAFVGDRDHIHHLINKKFSLSITNLILVIIALVPITFFSFLHFSFQNVLIIFLIIYVFLILILKKKMKYN
jgi:UDP-GlcNAc:undecaprenyl-phosphate/decaprenyl-phosphate GlcNAc-1-phosphate transferase